MATIRARKKADGPVSYTVQIRLKNKGVIVYQECQTFVRKQAAQAWTTRRETAWVVTRACADNRALIAAGLLDVPIAVNMSGYTFM